MKQFFGYKLAPDYRKATVWIFDAQSCERQSEFSMTPDKGTSYKTRYLRCCEFVKQFGMPIPTYIATGKERKDFKPDNLIHNLVSAKRKLRI